MKESDNLVDNSLNYQELFKKKSKTFSFASLFFNKEKSVDIAKLYYFFRNVDDIADDDNVNFETRRKNLISIKNDFLKRRSAKFNFLAVIFNLQKKYKIPNEVIIDFLNCMITDAYEEINIRNERELISYCYGAASTVGICMCYLLGVSDKRAFYHAIDLGIAMQLTNICRDIGEDFNRGRIYIPCLTENCIESCNQKTILKSQENYLDVARNYYQSGLDGLVYLPLRSRIIILIAAKLYERIGDIILKTNNFKLRSSTSFAFKIYYSFALILKFPFKYLIANLPIHNINLHKDLESMAHADK